MGLANEQVGPKILAQIKIYVLTRAELLFQVCYEIPCSTKNIFNINLTSHQSKQVLKRSMWFSHHTYVHSIGFHGQTSWTFS